VSDGRTTLSYRQLLSDADTITSFLLANGLRPGDRLGILASKSPRCVATMVGALQAGICYVPVDPRSPAPRARYILENARVKGLISERVILNRIATAGETALGIGMDPLLLLDDGPVARGDATVPFYWTDLKDASANFTPAVRNEDDPAYILYTSGSTGQPKGVVISHRNALTFVDWARERFGLLPTDRLSNHAPFHFDLSVFDLFGALTAGASVHLIPDSVAPFAGELARWIEESGITVWYSVPSALTRLMTKGDLSRYRFEQLRTVLFAGEVFPVKHLEGVMTAFPNADFFNLYGPTETNVCTYYPVLRPIPQGMEELPLGEACANIEVFAVTDHGSLALAGEEGELLVKGPCVMLGYWGLPQRTAESVIQNPLHSDFLEPVYRTGDRVRVLPEGGFQFLGRLDHMVKVRGYRVELGEVEFALSEHPGIRDAAVVALPDEDVGARLAAALVRADGASLSADDASRHCLNRLPRHAVPEIIVFMEELPMTSNGKKDRVTLKDLLGSDIRTSTTITT